VVRNSIRHCVCVVLICAWGAMLGCTVKPTKVTETKSVQTNFQEIRTQLNQNTVILDTRDAVEFYASKVPGSVLVEWKDFSVKLEFAEGVLDTDPLNITRRLALWGIGPDTQVIVLGKKQDPKFGRVAWMLKEMGVVNVKTFNFDLFKREVFGLNETPPENKDIWMPVVDTRSEIKFDEFQRIIFPFNYQFKFYTLSRLDEKAGLRVGRFKNSKIHFVDVRTAQEFKGESLKSWDSGFPLENIPWEQFYSNEGIVNFDLKKTLQAKGIQETDVIILVSNHGVRSGAATFALREMGYSESRNFSGGYDYLKNSMNLEKQINAAFFEKEKKRKTRVKKARRKK
jgi:thiosulfate/3-mercaptopyruvate sulfurtransferase